MSNVKKVTNFSVFTISFITSLSISVYSFIFKKVYDPSKTKDPMNYIILSSYIVTAISLIYLTYLAAKFCKKTIKRDKSTSLEGMHPQNTQNINHITEETHKKIINPPIHESLQNSHKAETSNELSQQQPQKNYQDTTEKVYKQNTSEVENTSQTINKNTYNDEDLQDKNKIESLVLGFLYKKITKEPHNKKEIIYSSITNFIKNQDDVSTMKQDIKGIITKYKVKNQRNTLSMTKTTEQIEKVILSLQENDTLLKFVDQSIDYYNDSSVKNGNSLNSDTSNHQENTSYVHNKNQSLTEKESSSTYDSYNDEDDSAEWPTEDFNSINDSINQSDVNLSNSASNYKESISNEHKGLSTIEEETENLHPISQDNIQQNLTKNTSYTQLNDINNDSLNGIPDIPEDNEQISNISHNYVEAYTTYEDHDNSDWSTSSKQLSSEQKVSIDKHEFKKIAQKLVDNKKNDIKKSAENQAKSIKNTTDIFFINNQFSNNNQRETMLLTISIQKLLKDIKNNNLEEFNENIHLIDQKELLENIRIDKKAENTLLHFAIESNSDVKIIEELLKLYNKYNIDISCLRNKEGKTLDDFAIQNQKILDLVNDYTLSSSNTELLKFTATLSQKEQGIFTSLLNMYKKEIIELRIKYKQGKLNHNDELDYHINYFPTCSNISDNHKLQQRSLAYFFIKYGSIEAGKLSLTTFINTLKESDKEIFCSLFLEKAPIAVINDIIKYAELYKSRIDSSIIPDQMIENIIQYQEWLPGDQQQKKETLTSIIVSYISGLENINTNNYSYNLSETNSISNSLNSNKQNSSNSIDEKKSCITEEIIISDGITVPNNIPHHNNSQQDLLNSTANNNLYHVTQLIDISSCATSKNYNPNEQQVLPTLTNNSEKTLTESTESSLINFTNSTTTSNNSHKTNGLHNSQQDLLHSTQDKIKLFESLAKDNYGKSKDSQAIPSKLKRNLSEPLIISDVKRGLCRQSSL